MSTPSLPTAVIAANPLADALVRLARGSPKELASLLHDVEVNTRVDGTNVVCHCHSLKLDGNGRPRVRDMVRCVCDHVLDYAIPRSEIAKALEDQKETGSSVKLTRLVTDARNLFTDLEKSGEGGELLLFVLAEQILHLPQIICKMDLKTNKEMHVHGADGLHAGTDPLTGKLVLYWGESKLFDTASDAIRDCLASIAPMLKANDNGNSQGDGDRDLQLLQRYADLNDPALEDALKRYLDPRSSDFNMLEFRGLCLVGFNSKAYPTEVNRIDLEAVVSKISSRLPKWKIQIANRVGKEKLTGFGFHFLCVPFPSVDDFRSRLRQELGLGVATLRTTSDDSTGTNLPIMSKKAPLAKKKTKNRKRRLNAAK